MEVLSLLEVLVLGARLPSFRPRKMMIEAMSFEELCNLLGATRVGDPVGPQFNLDLLANPCGVSEEEFASLSIVEHSVPFNLGGGDRPGLYDPVQCLRDSGPVAGLPLAGIQFGDRLPSAAQYSTSVGVRRASNGLDRNDR